MEKLSRLCQAETEPTCISKRLPQGGPDRGAYRRAAIEAGSGPEAGQGAGPLDDAGPDRNLGDAVGPGGAARETSDDPPHACEITHLLQSMIEMHTR